MTEVEQSPPQNGIDLSATEDEDNNKSRPADIEQDMREMERRKRVEAIMGSKLFREELERIVDSARDGGTSGILQQLSDIVGLPAARVGSVYKASNCLMPINDIRGVESMGYAKGEKILRCKLAATFRLLDLYGWTQGLGAQITARLKVDQEYFLVNPYGLLYHEITASSLNKVDMQGHIVEQGTTNFGVNKSHFVLHSVVHAARPDIRCAIYIGCSPVVAVSSLKTGLLPITRDACVLGEVTTHSYSGALDNEERDRLIRNLGPNSKVILLTNHGALCCGETIEEAFFAACHIVQACETQLKLLPVGLDNLALIPEESRKTIYEQSRRPPEDLEKKFAAVAANDGAEEVAETTPKIGSAPKWRVGGAEFEALMRMLDNAGYRTGYIYRHPLIKSDPPKPKNDVELPPAVSSLGYLLEEEELFRQGIWKKGDIRKGGDRSRWLNSPNVYQKVEVLETGTPDPKKITKWVAEGSPTHSTPVRIEDPLQFVPAGTNPKEFKRLQQQIKDNRRADKISAGPQSHILEGVTWDEANRIKDATVSSAGDHVVLMGAASKGIIQRGFQHNATVYKAPYAKNPFDNVTDDELNEYKRTVERKKKSIHGEYTDTDFSESEALSSLPAAVQGKHAKIAGATQSEPEDMGAHQVMRIETQQAPVPSQPEVVLSDATLDFLNGERTHTAVNRKPPTGRAYNPLQISVGGTDFSNSHQQIELSSTAQNQDYHHEAPSGEKYRKLNSTATSNSPVKYQSNPFLMELQNADYFKRQSQKHYCSTVNSVAEFEMKQLVKNNDSGRNYRQNNVRSMRTALPLTSYERNPLPFHWNRSPLFMNIHSGFNNFLDSPSKPNKITYTRKLQFKNDSISDYIYTYVGPMTNSTVDSGTYITEETNWCRTPAICNKILGSLPIQQQQQSSNNSYSYSNSTTSTSDNNTISRQRKDRDIWKNHFIYSGLTGVRRRAALAHRNNTCPYRTVSHFGFNSPRFIYPDHKHIPLDSQEKLNHYNGIQKAVSYEEIFSSSRYVDLCEMCFERVVKNKPDVPQVTARLRNIVEIGNTAENIDNNNYNYDSNRVGVGGENIVTSSSTSSEPPIYDYVDMETVNPRYVGERLEPLMENEAENSEDGMNNNKSKHNNEFVLSNSSFLDKIMRMNYSEESANTCFSPCAATSNISINTAEESGENVEPFVNEQNAGYTTNKLSSTDSSMFPVCVTELINFGNWLDRSEDLDVQESCELPQPEMHLSLNDTNTCKKYSLLDITEPMEQPSFTFDTISGTSSSDFEAYFDKEEPIRDYLDNNESLQQVNEITPPKCMQSNSEPFKGLVFSTIKTPITSSYDTVDHRASTASVSSPQPTLMSREERLRRKTEFQEIWEDHISFFDNKENYIESDVEEEEVQKMEAKCSSNQSENSNENKAATATPAVEEEDEEEVFFSRSFIVRRNSEDSVGQRCPLDDMTITNNNEFFDNMDSISTHTYNIASMESSTSDANQNSDCIFGGTDFDATMLINLKKARNLETNYEQFSNEQVGVEVENNVNQILTATDEELTDTELQVINKINENNLKECKDGEIFHKIENNIRNKLTPVRLEALEKNNDNTWPSIRKNSAKNLQNNDMKKVTSHTHTRQSRPTTLGGNRKIPRTVSALSMRRSCTAISRKGVKNSVSNCNIDNNNLPPVKQCNEESVKPRNFIRENIRNAAVARQKLVHNSPRNVMTPSNSRNGEPQREMEIFPTTSATAKLYNIQTNGKDKPSSLHSSSSGSICSNKIHKSNEIISNELISNEVTTKQTCVDLEIEALSAQLAQMGPRMDNIERKCDEFGGKLADCANTMDECISLQVEVINEQNQLNKDLHLNQYAEQILCQIETYSISETED